MKNFVYKIIFKISEFIFLLRIALKWIHDCYHLPLTSDHRELYNIIHRLCLTELGGFPNLVHCRDFNDRIQWLKLFDQSRDIIRCSDKILVRDYIRGCVGDKFLVTLYQVHDHFEQIDFNTLPDSFVLKANNDSGTVILVRDKSELDHQFAETKIETALRKPYGWQNGEWAYSYIEPKVLIEEYIVTESKESPPDYKFHCVNGKVRWIQYIWDRGNSTKETIVQPDGNIMSISFDHNMQHREDFVIPDNWAEMKSIAERLATPFKYVRVDMYCIEQNIYVGELTFYPMAGCYRGEGQKQIGSYLDFDRTTYKAFLLPKLEADRSRFSIYPAIAE